MRRNAASLRRRKAMLRHGSGLMQLSLCLTLVALVSGCASVGSGDALCDAIAADLTAHAAALALVQDDGAVMTGAALIQKIDAECDRPRQ